jgi:hypothetical protein
VSAPYPDAGAETRGVNAGREDARTVGEIEHEIAELKRRWPAHSVPPGMWDELERLENELEKARQEGAG